MQQDTQEPTADVEQLQSLRSHAKAQMQSIEWARAAYEGALIARLAAEAGIAFDEPLAAYDRLPKEQKEQIRAAGMEYHKRQASTYNQAVSDHQRASYELRALGVEVW